MQTVIVLTDEGGGRHRSRTSRSTATDRWMKMNNKRRPKNVNQVYCGFCCTIALPRVFLIDSA
jgi:hypothetical protein